MRHAVIMAGGAGTRLWPLSRKNHPKQIMRIFEGQSLLRRSFERLLGLLDPTQIHVIASREYASAMAEELPELPRENFMPEPCARDTANAVGLAAFLLARRDPEGTMGVFTADHIITPVDAYQRAVAAGFDAAERHPESLVTFGIRPTCPHTGYGYIHRGRLLEPGTYEVRQYKEKPDESTARQYVESGEYYWNSGMFAWRIPAILAQYRKHQPQIAAGLEQVAPHVDDPARSDWVRERFMLQTRISVDFAILEKADRVLVIDMPCEWLDVGSWTSLAEVLRPDAAGNTVAAPRVVTLNASNNILVSESEHLIAAIGVNDLIVVHAQDATLICRREDAQRIKEMVEQVKGAMGASYV